MIRRNILDKILPYLYTKEAVVITGMRRVGKTTLLSQIKGELKNTNCLSFDLENPLNRSLFEVQDYESIVESFRLKGLDIHKQSFVFLDEIQFCKNIPSVVKYISDHYNIKFFLTGSSSYYLKNNFTESLVGRKYVFELFPFSFEEFLLLKAPDINFQELKNKRDFYTYSLLKKYIDEYNIFGGFPSVILKQTQEEKLKALEDIFISYSQLELSALSPFRKISRMHKVIPLLTARVGSKIEVQQLVQPSGINRQTLKNYIDFLEDTYFIHRISPYTHSIDAEIRTAQKLYFCDSGLLYYFTKSLSGAHFENTVFNILKSKYTQTKFYQRKSGREIDFIIENTAYEVKITASDSDIRKTKQLSENIGLASAEVVSLEYNPNPSVSYLYNL